jgi:hypothetical protein
MFDQIVAEPDADFVERLRRRVLGELSEASLVEEPRVADRTDHQFKRTDGHRRATPARGRQPVSQRRRSRLVAVLLVAAIIAVVAVGILARKPSSRRIIPSTNTEPTTIGFSRHVGADLKTPDGHSFHFDGSVVLRTAIESDENNMPADQSDILFTPSISGSLTNTTGSAEPLSRLSVQLFLRTDSINCVVNSGACEPAILRDLTIDTASSSIAPGASVRLIDSGAISRSRVRRGDAPAILSQVRDGTLVAGIAVVVAGAAADQIATEIFDSEGNSVLSCGREPSDCMDASRSILDASGSPSVSVPAGAGSSAGPPPFPPGEIPPGTYTVRQYVLTTYGKWRVGYLNARSLLLIRDDSLLPALGIIEQSLSLMPTAAEAIAQICPNNTAVIGQPTLTTLFGTTAISVQGEVAGSCITPDQYPIAPAHGGHLTIRIVAGEVNRTMVAVFGYAPTDQWPAFSREMDATIASLRFA